jgi:hypothetical protein
VKSERLKVPSVRYDLSNAEAAEPAIGEVQVDDRALLSLRADAAAVADQQHLISARDRPTDAPLAL